MKFLKENYDYEEIEYEFDLERPVGVPDYWSGDQRYETEHVYHTYKVSVERVKEFLINHILKDMPDDQVEDYVEQNYDDLYEKHLEEIAKYFEDDAEMDAYQNG